MREVLETQNMVSLTAINTSIISSPPPYGSDLAGVMEWREKPISGMRSCLWAVTMPPL